MPKGPIDGGLIEFGVHIFNFHLFRGMGLEV